MSPGSQQHPPAHSLSLCPLPAGMLCATHGPSVHPFSMDHHPLHSVLLITRPKLFSAHLLSHFFPISAHPESSSSPFSPKRTLPTEISVITAVLAKDLATLKGFSKMLNMQIIIIIIAGNNRSSLGFLYFFL